MYGTKVAAGIKAAALIWNCTLKGPVDAKFAYEGKKSKRFLNRPIDDRTKEEYEGVLRQLWRYCVLTGNYEDMLPLLSPSPANAPSMSMETLENFLRFKRGSESGAPLLDSAQQSQIKDAVGRPMTTEGTWKAPKNADIFRAAVSVLHVAHGQRDSYKEPCVDCKAKPEGKLHEGRSKHPGNPQVFRCGNPTKDSVFENTMAQLKKDDHDYKEQGSSQLLPFDLRLLANRLLSASCIIALQTWVIILLAVKLFLRHDEFHDIDMSQFVAGMVEIKEHRVDVLVLEVFGKADKTWVTLKIYADHDYPELCPVRHLLIYLHLTGIKSGYLFPSAAELANPPADGHFKTTVKYEIFMRCLKNLCVEVLPYEELLKIGCHVF